MLAELLGTGLQSNWVPVTGVLPGLILEIILFNISSSNLGDATECTYSEFADDRRLGGVVDRPDGCAAIQWDLNRLEKWADLHLGSSCLPSSCFLVLPENWLGPSSSNSMERLF